MVTRGQQLYEFKNPPYHRVVLYEQRQFAKFDDSFLVRNEQHVPWNLLTEESRRSWEESAKGHYLFSGLPEDH